MNSEIWKKKHHSTFGLDDVFFSNFTVHSMDWPNSTHFQWELYYRSAILTYLDISLRILKIIFIPSSRNNCDMIRIILWDDSPREENRYTQLILKPATEDDQTTCSKKCQTIGNHWTCAASPGDPCSRSCSQRCSNLRQTQLQPEQSFNYKQTRPTGLDTVETSVDFKV